MCSTEEAGLYAVLRAIEQLDTDNRAGLTAAEAATRIAHIWAMLSELDPALARFAGHYQRRAPLACYLVSK